MVMVYMDIETYSPGRPSIEDKVIAIGGNTQGGQSNMWKEWKIGEKKVIEQFYDYIDNLLERERTVWLIGFNILKFDIPMLTYKAINFGMKDYESVSGVWRQCYLEDERQVLLPLNNFRFKGLSGGKIQEALVTVLREEIENEEVRVGEIKHRGAEICELYEGKEFKKIEEHLSSDLSFLSDLHYILRYHFDTLVDKKKEFMEILNQ